MPFDPISFALAERQLNPSVYNPNSGGRMQWRRTRADVRLGKGQRILACIGDSKTAGVGSAAPRVRTCYPGALALEIAARMPRLNANGASIFGNGGNGTTLAEFNTDAGGLVVGTGAWAPASAQLGGTFLLNSSDTTGTLTYTPGITCDTIEIWWARGGGFGTFSWQLDGGAVTNVSTAGTTSYEKTTITFASGSSHSLVLKRVSGNCYWGGFTAWDSTKSNLRIDNWGSGGTDSGHWSTVGQFKNLGVGAIGPHHSFLQLGVNDWNGHQAWMGPGGTYETQMSAIITQCKLTGGVTLIAPSPMNTAAISQAGQDEILASNRRLALQHDLSLIEFTRIMRSYSEALSLGLMFDGLHEGERGYDLEATCVADYLLD